MKRGFADRYGPALVLAPEAPYPMAGGGPVRTASILEYIARRRALDVIVFREPGAPDPRESFPSGLVRSLEVIELPFHSRRPLARAGRNLGRYIRARPPLNDRFGGFDARLAALLDGRRYELAIVEHFWCAPYWKKVAAHADRTVLDLHNVDSLLYGRTAECEPWPVSAVLRRFARACRGMERRWLPRFSTVLVASKQDAVAVSEIAPETRVTVYPNALPVAPQPAVEEENALIFSGNLEYQPNVDAVRYFRRQVWPLLRERWPGLVWRLVGKNPGGVAGEVYGDSRIELLGPVEDAIQALAAARVAVVPLLAGSGTRVKILEAWAAGRPVVSTAIGAEGLPARHGEHLLVAETPEAFAAAVSTLLESSGERRRLGRGGRTLYEKEFTWPRVWEILETI